MHRLSFLRYFQLLATAALCVTAHELVDATSGIDQL